MKLLSEIVKEIDPVNEKKNALIIKYFFRRINFDVYECKAKVRRTRVSNYGDFKKVFKKRKHVYKPIVRTKGELYMMSRNRKMSCRERMFHKQKKDLITINTQRILEGKVLLSYRNYIECQRLGLMKKYKYKKDAPKKYKINFKGPTWNRWDIRVKPKNG